VAAIKQNYYTLYKATSPSGKVYVGYTSFRLKDRMLQHYSDAKRGKKRPFYSALRKYGNKVKWKIINIYYTKEFVQNRERYYISLFQSNNLMFGYNSTSGGEGTPNLQFSKTKYIDNNGNIYFGTRDVFNKTGVNKSTLINSIKNNFWCGNIYFSVYKEGMKAAEKRLTKPKSEKIRKVICNKNQVCFFSMRDAAIFLGVIEQAIFRVVSGKRFSVKGYELRYIDDTNPHKKPEKKIKIKKGRIRKSILCKNTGIIYKNIDVLCSDMNLVKNSVLAVCTKIRKSCHGYKFEYITGGGLSLY
jgi:group I intron endonuclease